MDIIGDNGETSNLSGEKISKNDNAIHFEGTADELSSHLGLVKVMLCDKDTRQFVEEIQTKLMKLMAHVSDNKNSAYFFSKEDVDVLEKETATISEKLPKQSGFILPGKSITEAQIHIARTVARRAERMFAAVSQEQTLCPYAASYINKLSNYLFVLSRQNF